MSTPKLTAEQLRAIEAQPSGFTRVEDDRTQKSYLIIEEAQAMHLYEQWLRDQLQIGFDQADRGELAEWNLDQFLAKMHQQHGELTSQAE
jgi:hypothetical protein